MDAWVLLVVVFLTSLFTVGIAFAALWLGWNLRDKAGQAQGEPPVGLSGLSGDTQEAVTFAEWSAKEIDEDIEV